MTSDAGLYATVDAFLAGLVAGGVRNVVVSPGSRSTPLAVPARARDDLDVDVILDERAAGFFALGRAKATRSPVVLVCTSGTAGANYYPAIIEAQLSRVSLVVLTADRPPELWGWDAGQTIDQVHLFGRHAQDFVQMPIGEFEPHRAERIGFRAAVTSSTGPRGPVHVNWPFREPFEPPDEWIETYLPPRSVLRSEGPVDQSDHTPVLDQATKLERGLIVVGPLDAGGDAIAAIGHLAGVTGWPVVADPLSQLRSHHTPALVLDAADHVLRSPAASRLAPDVIVRVGATPTSKAFRLWVERTHPAQMILIDPDSGWSDPSGALSTHLQIDVEALGRVRDPGPRRGGWSAEWDDLNRRARKIVDETIGADPLLELGIAASVAEHVPAGKALMVASSMPVRDLDMAMPGGGRQLRIFANRGANGIDGTIATGAGISAATGQCTILIGDLALLHDLGGAFTAGQQHLDLTIVVMNNGGGGIFSLLPIAAQGERIHFDELFRTPQGADFAVLAELVGASYDLVTDPDSLGVLLSQPGGLRIIEIPVDPEANVAQLDSLGEAIRRGLA
ncbi:MAG: 2-succinyl-5-enolpyruvyl-6-hydroxy-3-cyclohexene-1-carboxylic-acid synthase [Acidimicrobiia bacterium]|nr:2-succinyl-5-enolpyruvyl-6-hydroxy-3-cyclohexene-1-carboxylic-acid synthase [Acidimicrobiia bacterium]